MNTLGEKIEELLQKHNMSQKELAEKANVTEAAISKYIKSGRTPRADILGKISSALGVTTDYLLGNENSKNETSENDIEKVVNKTIDLLGKTQDFYLCGMPLDEDDIELVKSTMLNGVEYAKSIIQKKNKK